MPVRDACVAVTAGVRGFLGRSRVRGGLWAERIAPVNSVVDLLGGAYRAFSFFRGVLLAGRIAPVISVVVYWVERIAPVRMWVWRNLVSVFGGLILFVVWSVEVCALLFFS